MNMKEIINVLNEIKTQNYVKPLNSKKKKYLVLQHFRKNVISLKQFVNEKIVVEKNGTVKQSTIPKDFKLIVIESDQKKDFTNSTIPVLKQLKKKGILDFQEFDLHVRYIYKNNKLYIHMDIHEKDSEYKYTTFINIHKTNIIGDLNNISLKIRYTNKQLDRLFQRTLFADIDVANKTVKLPDQATISGHTWIVKQKFNINKVYPENVRLEMKVKYHIAP